MKTSTPSNKSPVTDPLARAIEGHLFTIEAHQGGKLRVDSTDGGVCLGFGKCEARAKDYETALVRLARVLVDDAHFKSALLDALLGPMRLEEALRSES
jgi:hypothetical protein